MRPDQIGVLLGGVAAIGLIVWFFWLKPVKGVRAAVTSSGYQEAMILVKGGYTPDAIVVEKGKPVRLLFRQEDESSCAEMVVIGAFGKSAKLPVGQVTPVEFMPTEQGTYDFTCQMGMYRGKIVVE